MVGFEVMPCSIKREKGDAVEDVKCNPWGDPSNPEPQEVHEGADIIYTCASDHAPPSIDHWHVYICTSTAFHA